MMKTSEKQNSLKLALSVSDLTVNYGPHRALFQINLEIPKGLLIGIIGPNGAGKSTLIKTALGLIKPNVGFIKFFGQSIDQFKGQIGYVPQRESVDWDFPLTVHDLVLMGRYGKIGLVHKPKQTDYQITQNCLEKVGLHAYSGRQISQLSCGQQQRAFIARALAQEASVYFMDEPFAGVDLSTESVIISLLKQLTQKLQKTIFVVHHDLHNIPQYYDWVIMLNTVLVAAGDVKNVFNAENIKTAFIPPADTI
jgi:manganese/zinc/iron transport system ATP- binding protein